jgi:signal transduction histidine kinase
MPWRRTNCWEALRCGREPGGPREHELGPCPAATDVTCHGTNAGRNAGRICWAVAGTLCTDRVEGGFAEKIDRCSACSFFRRVKYEEGCHFQLLKPGLGTRDVGELHRLLNDAVALIGISRDIFACLAERPLLARIAEHALRVTRASSASAYVFAESGEELVLQAHAGSVPRPERVRLEEACPVAEAARTKRVGKACVALAGCPGPVSIAAAPIGGRDRLAGVLEVIKADGAFTVDDEWFLREFALVAALGAENARLVEDLRQLKRFDKAKSRFVALLMHHIGSPLATIACSLQALAQLGEKLSEEDREKLIGFSLQRIDSIQTLSKRLLDLAAIRSGSSLGQVRPVCLAEPLRHEVESRMARARDLGVTLVVTDRAGEEPQILADPDGLRVIFANLLGNAIKYCAGPEKRVEAQLTAERGEARVSIRDTGIGIPPEDQARVFEEFHRASNAPASHAKGYGIGLAVVKELVDRYGGHIELESTVGIGTSITVAFPIVEEASEPPA